jgi:hypothetical protein
MRNVVKTVAYLLIAGALASGLVGCAESFEVAEKAQEAVEQAKEAAEGITQGIEDATEDASGNVNHSPVAGVGQTLKDYFEGKTFYFYRQTNSSLDCESGACPDSTEIPDYMVNEECFFGGNGSEVHDDSLTVHISPVTTTDSLAGCVKTNNFIWPEELSITEKDEDLIIAHGMGHGRVEQTGSGCDSYAYSFTTDETWIFSTGKLEDIVSMDVYTGAPQNPVPTISTWVIDAPGWDNPPAQPLQYSHFGITITAEGPYKFRTIPEIRLLRIENHRLNTSVLKMDRKELLENKTQFNFAASFNADYVVVPALKIIGKNGAVLREIIDDGEYIIRVTDSPQGNLPN